MTETARAALITGGTGRVGSAIAARLEAEGFAVLAAGRRDGDIARPDEARALVVALMGRIVLPNGFEPRPVEEVSEEDWDAALDSTAKGTFFVTQAAVPHLRASNLGLVVMIEDVGAFMPWASFGPHCAAKAAQAMLTRVFARALAPDIRVCGIAPGPVAVEPEQEQRRAAETLLGRIGSPEDIAGAVAYLVGAGFVTGSTLFVDGGRSLNP